MKLVFNKDSKAEVKFSESLSTLARVGNDLWVGGDEGVIAYCMRSSNNREEFHPEYEANLAKEFQLPGIEIDDKLPEVDLEGMDWDPAGYLWMVASHSLKRSAAEREKKDQLLSSSQNIGRLGELSADGNRFLLGRLALKVDPATGNSTLPVAGDDLGGKFTARLDCTTRDSGLLEALADDELLGPFLKAPLPPKSEEEKKDPLLGIPGKDNGVDIEGLAFVKGSGHLLIGLRGPVLRGMAVILELNLTAKPGNSGEVGKLSMSPPGASARTYLRHFVDLGGLSIRDLCFDGDDLLILAGPTQPIEWPLTIFRWAGAKGKLGKAECVVWRQLRKRKDNQAVLHAPEDGEIEVHTHPSFEDGMLELESEGRPEGLGRWDDNKLIVVYDGADGRRRERKATVILEEIPLRRKEAEIDELAPSTVVP